MFGFGTFAYLTFAQGPFTQTSSPAVGKITRRTINRSDFERRLSEQKKHTFTRRWWDELQEAERAALDKAEETKSKAQRRALEKAAKAAADVAEEISETGLIPAKFDQLNAALIAAASAERIKGSLESARQAMLLAESIMAWFEKRAADEDEDEAISLLLMH